MYNKVSINQDYVTNSLHILKTWAELDAQEKKVPGKNLIKKKKKRKRA